ncbi:MAG: aprataxin-like protein [Sclerophora amabilis]|nr:MAG: aprataxin-like protein [Sclerophora amabilis]
MEDKEQDAIDEDEISGTAVPRQRSNSGALAGGKRNAFSELMARNPAHHSIPSRPSNPGSDVFLGRAGLGAYIKDPTSFPRERVISHNERWVVINDLYPKSSVHVLLLSRDGSRNKLHPFDALADPTFLAEVQGEVKKLRGLVATELRRRYGQFSAQEQAREKAMESDSPPNVLPTGRDWGKDVMSGIHAHPSMSHLHVHILGVDRVSECMRKKKHYNSFATPFLIDVDDFPLSLDDPRRHPGRQGYLDAELKCWRCGKGFGSRFGRLKQHLEEEFEAWKRE